jgi:hypothetical protein
MNQSSKQTLLNIVRHQLRELEQDRQYYKALANKHWKGSVPKTVNGILEFKSLNECRTQLRLTISRIKKLSAIARELKA